MIIQDFTVSSGRKTYTFKDRMSIDSEAERSAIQQVILTQIDLMQQDAMCAALGIEESGPIPNIEFGVYERGQLVGVFFVAKLDYQSGPWADLDDWEVVSSDPAVFHARVMPGFVSLREDDSLSLAVDSVHKMLSDRMTSMGGAGVEFKKFSWALFKGRKDASSVFMEKNHDRAKADARFEMTEAPDPNNAALTRVDLELK